MKLYASLFTLALSASVWLIAAPLARADDAGKADALERAQAAAQALGGTLKQALVERMQAEGPLGAVDFCHQQAQPLTRQVAQAHSARLGRVGVRNRNPLNAVTGWQHDALEQIAARYPDASGAPVVEIGVSADGGSLRYARSLSTEGPCLVCHGPQVEPELLAAIRAKYPQDAASGFAEGELRGVLWVEVPIKPVR